jgi:type VI secretion system protein ImpA
MSAVAVDALLVEVSADSPCGANLEYDPDYMEMMRLSQGTPERQMGTTILPAEEPNWRDLRERCVGLLKRTKDLAVAVKLCESMVRTDGIPGLRDGLALVSGILNRYWDQLYPQLDPSDGNDPTYRLNILAGLNDAQFLAKVRAAPLTNSVRAGKYGLREVGWASGRVAPPPETSVPKMDVIDAAFRDTPPEELVASSQAAEHSIGLVKEMDAGITQRVGAGRGVDFAPLLKVLQEVQAAIRPHLPAGAAGNGDAMNAGDEGGGAGARGAGVSAPGEIRSNDDVLNAIERICAFYERHEPSSPVPILLKRAQRLVGKGMLDILRELLPEAVKPMEALGGIKEEAT